MPLIGSQDIVHLKKEALCHEPSIAPAKSSFRILNLGARTCGGDSLFKFPPKDVWEKNDDDSRSFKAVGLAAAVPVKVAEHRLAEPKNPKAPRRHLASLPQVLQACSDKTVVCQTEKKAYLLTPIPDAVPVGPQEAGFHLIG